MRQDIQEILEQIEKLPNGVLLFYPQMPPAFSQPGIATDDLHKLVSYVREIEAERRRIADEFDALDYTWAKDVQAVIDRLRGETNGK